MNSSERFQAALEFATLKHAGQYRIGGLPYITHPRAVAEILREKGYGEDYQIAGLFHDLLEDTDAQETEIEMLGGREVLEAVRLVTKQKGYVMAEYISGIRKNPMATAVKAADRLHNLQCAVVADTEFKRKYILESIDWYLDFDTEIPKAVKALADTLDMPIRSLSMEYTPLQPEEEMRTASFVIRGDIVYSLSSTEMAAVRSGYAVCIDGKSQGVFENLPPRYRDLRVYEYSGKLIIPGLVDLHIHAPQYSFRGTGMDMELMEWLQKQAFPEEARYADMEYAEKAYHIFAEAMRKSATSHACIFATKHRPATELLMGLMERSGIISFVGKVNMDREAPDALCEPDADYSAFDTFGWINRASGKYRRTKPILTPRFIPCCTPGLLEQLREIQIAYDLPVQSHLSESKEEVEFVRKLVSESEFYGDAYDGYGLFGKEHRSGKPVRTVMAHCVYSTDGEIQRMKENGVFVAHCPASNINLSSGIAPIRKYLNLGLNIGLGSDVAGGHSESMFRAICDAIQVSKLYRRLVDHTALPLSFKETFYLATKGGGAFFGRVGSFEKDYDFSAVVLDDSLLPHPRELTIAERIERAVYESLDLYGICAKYVSGNKVFSREESEGIYEDQTQ
jgi:guanine deaminase